MPETCGTYAMHACLKTTAKQCGMLLMVHRSRALRPGTVDGQILQTYGRSRI